MQSKTSDRVVCGIKLLGSFCCAQSTDKASHFWPTCFCKATEGKGGWEERSREVCLRLSELPGCVTIPCGALNYPTLPAAECLSVERYCGSLQICCFMLLFALDAAETIHCCLPSTDVSGLLCTLCLLNIHTWQHSCIYKVQSDWQCY